MDKYKNLLEMVPKLSIGMNLAQFMLFTINFVFAVVGTLLLVMAFAIDWACDQYMPFLQFNYFEALLAFGIIMLLLSFFGGMATIGRSTVRVNIFGGLLLILLVVIMNAAITIFIIHDNIYSSIEANMVETLNNQTSYDWDYVLGKWNYMQDRLHCCGIHGPKDWAPLHIDGPIETDDDFTYSVPYSCCDNFYSPHHQANVQCYNLHSYGCLWRLNDYVFYGLTCLGCLTIATVISLLLGLICTIALAKSIRRLKTEEEMKRQEIQHLIYTDLHKPEEEKLLVTSSSSNP